MQPVKTFLRIAAMALLCCSCVRAQTFVQGQSATYTGSINSPDSTGWPANPTAGHVILHFYMLGSAAGTVTMANAQSTTVYNCGGGPYTDSTNAAFIQGWASHVTSTAADNWTGTFTNYSGSWQYANMEYSGVVASGNPCDSGTGQGILSNTAWTTGTWAMNDTNEAIVGGCASASSGNTPTTLSGTPSGTVSGREFAVGYTYLDNVVTTRGTGSLSMNVSVAAASACIGFGLISATQPSPVKINTPQIIGKLMDRFLPGAKYIRDAKIPVYLVVFHISGPAR
jgi:hypothetical protein